MKVAIAAIALGLLCKPAWAQNPNETHDFNSPSIYTGPAPVEMSPLDSDDDEPDETFHVEHGVGVGSDGSIINNSVGGGLLLGHDSEGNGVSCWTSTGSCPQ